jgi:catechol 2,3-dioxygenase-like lactoylglutathione lyase family enzyme
MRIERLDHLVLTVADLDRTVDFYTRSLGMEAVSFDDGRRALAFGEQKINLHQVGHEFEPKAQRPTAGSGDLCFVTDSAIDDVVAHLTRQGVDIEVGPVPRAGALGPMDSVYVRDPDGNLVEISHYR